MVDETNKEIEELNLLKNPTFLEQIADEISKKVEGEREAIKTIFMVFNMRNVANLNKASDNLMVNDEGGTGKDHVVSKTFEIIPTSEKDKRERISPKVLAYLNDTKQNPTGWLKKCLYLEDVPNQVLNDDAFKVMCSANPDGTTQTSIIINNVLRNIDIRGKASIVITIAVASPKKELLRRFPILNLTSSIDQTKAVMLKHAEFAQNGNNGLDYNPLFTQALSRLKRVKVKIPYAKEIAEAFPSGNVIIRTHFPRFLDYIKSSTSLYQYAREQDEEGNYLSVEQDYEISRNMMAITTSNQLMIPLTKLQKNILERFEKIVKGNLEEQKYSFDELYERMTELSGESWLRKNVNRLVEYGFIERYNENRDGNNKPTGVYKFKDINKLELPKFKELKNCPNKELKENKENKENNPYKLKPQDSKGIAYLDNMDYLDNKSSDSNNLIHHKCHLCDQTPCVKFDEQGRPVCEFCASNNEGLLD